RSIAPASAELLCKPGACLWRNHRRERKFFRATNHARAAATRRYSSPKCPPLAECAELAPNKKDQEFSARATSAAYRIRGRESGGRHPRFRVWQIVEARGR